MSKFAEAAAAVAKIEGYPYDHVNSHHRDIVRVVLQTLRDLPNFAIAAQLDAWELGNRTHDQQWNAAIDAILAEDS